MGKCGGCGRKYSPVAGKLIPAGSVSLTQPLIPQHVNPNRVKSDRGIIRQPLVVPAPTPSTENKS